MTLVQPLRALCGVLASAAALACPLSPASAADRASITQLPGSSGAVAVLDQSGASNASAVISQDGSSPTATIVQSGSGGAGAAEIDQSGGTGQQAYVEQNGARDHALVVQSQAGGATSLGAGSLLPASFTAQLSASFDPSSHPSAVIAQLGDQDRAELHQLAGADGSYAEIGQRGDHNLAVLTQSAASSFASIYQSGDGDQANITQTGSGLTGSITQTGDLDSANLTQTGEALYYRIVQDGVSTQASSGTSTIGFVGATSIRVEQTDAAVHITLH